MPADLIAVTGIVIAVIPIGDYDKRITLLTKERGKIQAFVHGARRPNSSFVAATNPFIYGTFELHLGKNYNLSKVTVLNYFEKLQTNLDSIYYGSYFLELAGYYTQENNNESEMLKLLYVSLKALEKQTIPNRLIRCVFELKTLVINGEYPDVFACRLCKKEDNLTYFSTVRGGCICSDCMRPIGSIPLLPSALYTLQFIVTTPVQKLYSFTVSEEVLENLERIMKDYLSCFMDRKLKSLQFLE